MYYVIDNEGKVCSGHIKEDKARSAMSKRQWKRYRVGADHRGTFDVVKIEGKKRIGEKLCTN
jgi:hypothetical protein